MRKKVSCFSTRVWAGFLALLGFASCTSNEDPEDIPLEYGTPTVGFQVQGVVTDEEGNPLEDIQVIVRRAYNNDYRSGIQFTRTTKGRLPQRNLLQPVSSQMSRKFISMTKRRFSSRILFY